LPINVPAAKFSPMFKLVTAIAVGASLESAMLITNCFTNVANPSDVCKFTMYAALLSKSNDTFERN